MPSIAVIGLVTSAMPLAIGFMAGLNSGSMAQEKCGSTLNCAQQAVEIAGRAEAALKALEARLAKAEKEIADMPTTISNSLEFAVFPSSLAEPRHEAIQDCGGRGSLVGGSCIGFNGGTQVAIGPVYFDPVEAGEAGRPAMRVRCQPNTDQAGMRVRAFAVCMRPKK